MADDINERRDIPALSFVTSATIGTRRPRNQARHPRIICHGTGNNSEVLPSLPPSPLLPTLAHGCWLKPAIIAGHLSARNRARESNSNEILFSFDESAMKRPILRCSTFESPGNEENRKQEKLANCKLSRERKKPGTFPRSGRATRRRVNAKLN